MLEAEKRADAQEILKSLSVQDKAKLLSQIIWETTDIEKMHPGLKKFLLADGPAGIRRLKDYFDEDIYNTRPSTCYPSPGTYAGSWDRKLICELGEHMGRESRQENVDTMLAPAVNIKRSPLGGRNFEYYSEDPYLTGELAAEFIKGIQKEGIGACLKHFAVNNQETRRMNICAEVDEETLHEVYLAAFEKPVKEGKPKMVMAAYNQVNGQYCASHSMLLNILRKEWGYEGVVVTDCYAAHDLGNGIRHGLTLQMPGESEERITERVKELLENGEITEDDLNQAVLCNIRFALDAEEHRNPDYQYDRDKHHAFAQKLAEESMILLKNENSTLPLTKVERILIAGELAVHPRFQGGGSSHVNPWKLEIPLEEMQRIGGQVDFTEGYKLGASDAENKKLRESALEAASRYRKIIVFAGIPDLIESEGYDRDSLRIPDEQNQLISELAEKGFSVIVVLANGSVVEMPWRDQVSAILESYLGGEAGASAVSRILYGEANPSGRLAETFPVCLEDNPSYLYFPGGRERVFYGEGRFAGYKHYEALHKAVAFPFGHGLSYTEFEYSAKGSIYSAGGTAGMARLQVKNTGDRAGKEVIQVYVRKIAGAEGTNPIKLAGFEKVYLEPGEEKEITVKLYERAFMCYHAGNHAWEAGNGVYELTIGSSVRDIRLRETLDISHAPTKITRDSNIGDMIRTEGMYEKLEKAFADHPVSLGFLQMTQDEDPLKAISMGSLMTFETLKRTDPTLSDSDIEKIIRKELFMDSEQIMKEK